MSTVLSRIINPQHRIGRVFGFFAFLGPAGPIAFVQCECLDCEPNTPP